MNPRVFWKDPFSGIKREYTNLRDVTNHGYRCPICRSVIDSCHGAAQDPNDTMPGVNFEIAA